MKKQISELISKANEDLSAASFNGDYPELPGITLRQTRLLQLGVLLKNCADAS